MNSSPKAIAERYAQTLWNDKDLSVIDELVSENIVIHSPMGDFHGLNALNTIVRAWLTGFPDLHVQNDVMISENDLVCLQWHASGTHLGEFKGKQPTKKTVAYSGVTVYRIDNGKIVEYAAFIDMQHLLN